MTTKKEMEHRFKHRAVAPIIATLLMVAISVVGGILIFVFAQGFFTDSSIHSPAIESLEIFGFDARDDSKLRPHNFDSNPATAIADNAVAGLQVVSVAADGKLSELDAFAVYVRNKGASAIVISKVTVFGIDYKLPTTAAACSATVPAKKLFAVSTDGTIATCATGSGVIGVGQEATIYVRYDGTQNGPVKIGRPMLITIATGNGAIFTKQIQNGIQIGS